MSILKSTAIAVSLLTASVGIGMQMDSDVTVSGLTVTDSKGNTNSILGACTTDSKTFTCWTPDGNSDPKLAENAAAYFDSHSDAFLNLRFNHRTVLLAFESSGFSPSYYGRWDLSAESPLTMSPNSGSSAENVPQDSYAWVYPTESQKSINVFWGFTIQRNSDQNVKSKVGETFKIGSILGKIDSISLLPPQSSQNFPYSYYMQAPVPKKAWSINISLSNLSEEDSKLSLSLSTFDKNGEPITEIDKNGAPVEKKSAGNSRGMQMTQTTGISFSSSYGIKMVGSTGSATITTFVDPSKIDSLKFQYSLQKHLKVGSVPLSPN